MRNIDDVKALESLGVISSRQCSKSECDKIKTLLTDNKPLPKNVIPLNEEKNQFVKVFDPGQDEILERLLVKQAQYTRRIMMCTVAFLALSAIGLFMGFLGIITI